MAMSKAPPPRSPTQLLGIVPIWAIIALAGLFGGIGGLGTFTFLYAEGASYLSNDPSACVNCHVMREVFDGWNHGTHKAVAACNDCHTPHELVPKYFVKALNGFKHSAAFTLGGFHEPIEITDFDRQVALEQLHLLSQRSHICDESPGIRRTYRLPAVPCGRRTWPLDTSEHREEQ